MDAGGDPLVFIIYKFLRPSKSVDNISIGLKAGLKAARGSLYVKFGYAILITAIITIVSLRLGRDVGPKQEGGDLTWRWCSIYTGYTSMATRIQKWGNSLAVRLPKVIAEHFRLRQGSAVRILSRSRHIVIKPSLEKSITLADLVRKITPENRHEEVRWGRPKGREVW